MIYSMTAFAHEEMLLNGQQLTCEIRSINHRYAEISVHLPETLRIFEMIVRDKIRKHLKRGKIDCNIRLQQSAHHSNSVTLAVDKNVLSALLQANNEIIAHMPFVTAMTSMEVLRFPGVLQAASLDPTELENAVVGLVDKTLKTIIKHRGQEGDTLLPLFHEKLHQIEECLKEARSELPHILKMAREKLLTRFQESSVQLNAERLEQEMIFFAQKMDVTEEIERAEAHVKAIFSHLKEGGPVGRQLDFLLQELNREANTLGSKSVHQVTTKASLQMKVLIEQIREQVQNIE